MSADRMPTGRGISPLADIPDGECRDGGRVGVEEPLHMEPPHDTTAHLLGERGQIGLGDRSSRQERRQPVAGRHENAVGHARMQMHVVVER